MATLLAISQQAWEAVEEERKKLSEPMLAQVLDRLEYGETDRRQLLDLRATAHQPGWWDEYSALFDNDIKRFFGLEAGADLICAYDTLLIPGLLQTPEYTRAIMSDESSVRDVEVDDRVEARRQRQQRLHDGQVARTVFVFSEAALRQQIGGPDVLRAQLEHLLTVMDRHSGNVEVRVLPFTAPACNLLGSGSVCLFDFNNPRLPRVAWHETVSTWGTVTDPGKVRDISDAFTEAFTRAATPKHTREIVERHRDVLC